MQMLIADNDDDDSDDDDNDNGIEGWSHVFLKGLLSVPMLYALLIRYGLQNDSQEMSSIAAARSLPLANTFNTSNTSLVANGVRNKQVLVSVYHTLCHRFLFCYLQPICWNVSLRVSQQLRRSPNTALHYPQLDCFAIACYQSTRPDRLLRRFDFNANTALAGYAFGAIQKATKNQIAQELKSKSIKFSNYGLLRQVSQRRLERSLTLYGISATDQQRYRLVWLMFKNWANDMGASDRFRLGRSLTLEQTEAIARLCNQRCEQLQLNLNLSPQQIQAILETCTKAIQREEGQPTTSLDALTDNASPTAQSFEPLSDYGEPIMAQEQQAVMAELRQTIQTALATLEVTARQALFLWLGLGLNQTDFIPLLQVQKQYQVARQFQRYQRTILKATMQAYQQANPEANLTDKAISTVCKTQLAIIKEYLEQYSQRLFAEQLENLVLAGKSREGQWRNATPKGGSPLLAFTAELAERSPTARQTIPMSEAAKSLKQQFKRQIEDRFSLQLGQFPSLDEKVNDFIKSWLVNHQAMLY